jgi:Ca-activated chloride channel family protein
MFRHQHRHILAIFALVAVSLPAIVWAQAKPITEKQLITLVETGIEDAVIAQSIEKQGLAFDADDATIARLKEANVSDTVLKAIQTAAESKRSKPAAAGKTVITYDRLLILLETGVPEEEILKILERSPTIFTLGEEQTAELKKAGASERLLKAMAGERAAVQPRPQQKATITDFAIVFDCSGSMGEKTSDGQTKMDVAKELVAKLVNSVPDGLNLTFVIYGHDKQLNCQAVKIVRPLGRIDAKSKAQLAATVKTLKPVGNTPIALALSTAGKELFKNNANCGMVLVSDGKETCNGNPTAEAARLAKNDKLSFGIQVVGFDVTPDERRSLEEIATAGEGKYFNAQTSDDLVAVLDDIARQLKEAATPPKVVAMRRAIMVLSPKINLPDMEDVYIVPADTPLAVVSTYRKGGVKQYDAEISIPSSTAKYDVIFAPKGGQHIRLIDDFNLPERRIFELRPEEYVSMIRVQREGTAKQIVVAPAGTPGAVASSNSIQRAKAFGEIMVVPLGKYDIYVDGNLIEEGFEVKPGTLHDL